MADLITLEEYKALGGVQSADTRNDAQVTALLEAASRLVRNYTGRSFDIVSASEDRTFQYDESGMLDIDDAVAVSQVVTNAGVPNASYTLTPDEWTAMPQDDSEVFYYILIHGGPYYGASPAMGFERNLDQYPLQHKEPVLTVTAQWGWPAVPEDVKLATTLIVSEFVGSAGGAGRSEGLTAEAIEGWSRAWGGRTGEGIAQSLPNRARDILAAYQRIFV